MPQHQTLMCLVSAQATPNLLPIIDMRWKPERVVLAVSSDMEKRAQALREVITRSGSGIKVELLVLGDAYDYTQLCDAFLGYLSANEDEDIALNVTGGTKLMAVAAQEVFRSAGKPVIYVNVENDEVITLGQKERNAALQGKLKVRDLLESHGFEVTGAEHPQVTAERRDLAARLIDHANADGRALGTLNWLASTAGEKGLLQVRLVPQDHLENPSFMAMADLFADAGLIKIRGGILTFLDSEAVRFVNGGWLESFSYNAIQDLRGSNSGITDVVMNVVIHHPDGKTRNEVDVAFLYRNTLHLIECKTANLAQEGMGGDDKATEAIYKMEALLKVGGLRTKGMILDYRGSFSASKANLNRASNAGIQVVAGQKLGSLKQEISRLWLRH